MSFIRILYAFWLCLAVAIYLPETASEEEVVETEERTEYVNSLEELEDKRVSKVKKLTRTSKRLLLENRRLEVIPNQPYYASIEVPLEIRYCCLLIDQQV